MGRTGRVIDVAAVALPLVLIAAGVLAGAALGLARYGVVAAAGCCTHWPRWGRS